MFYILKTIEILKESRHFVLCIWQIIAGKNRNRNKEIPKSIRYSIQDRFIHTLFSSVLNARPVKRRQKLKVFLHTNAQRANVSFSLVTLYCWLVNSTAGPSIVKNLKLLHIYSCGNSKLWLKQLCNKRTEKNSYFFLLSNNTR